MVEIYFILVFWSRHHYDNIKLNFKMKNIFMYCFFCLCVRYIFVTQIVCPAFFLTLREFLSKLGKFAALYQKSFGNNFNNLEA